MGPMRGDGLGFVPFEPVRGLKRRRRFPLQREQIQVLLYARADGSGTPSDQFSAQKLNGLGPLPLRGRGLRLYFD